MKDLRIVARVYNNQLRERRELLGLSQTALAERIGLPFHEYCKIEGMKLSPFTSAIGPLGKPREPRWRGIATKLAAFYQVTPEVLFPEAVRQMQKVVAEIRVDAEEVALMLSPPVESSPIRLLVAAEDKQALDDALGVLDKRERRIITGRFGLDGGGERTLAELGDEFNLSRERIRSLEARALRKVGDTIRQREAP